MTLKQRAISVAGFVGASLLSGLSALAATSTTSEAVQAAIDQATPVYNAGISGGTTAATSLLPYVAGFAVLLVLLSMASYGLYRLIHIFHLGGRR
jgi:hypothetical protein